MGNTNKQVDETNLGAVWVRVAELVKKLTGDVEISKKGNLQEQITKHTDTEASSSTSGHVKVDSALSKASANPIQNKVVATALENSLTKTGNTQENKVTFTQAASRTNIATGETHATMFGKIKRWFSDLTSPAFAQVITSYDDLMANTVDGYMADAQAVKEGFASVNSDLGNIKIINGTVSSKILEKNIITNIGEINLEPGLYLLTGSSQINKDAVGVYMIYCTLVSGENEAQLHETVVRNIDMRSGGGAGFASPVQLSVNTTIKLYIINSTCNDTIKNQYTRLEAIKIR